MIISGAESIFDSLKKYEDIKNLILEGECESLYLECKPARSSKLNADMKKHLARAVSGFSNSNGGVIIYGISTDKKSGREGEESLDTLTEIENIGSVDVLMKNIRNAIPSLTIPSVFDFQIKTIKPKGKNKGVTVVLIKRGKGDPLQSTQDYYFYFRSGDEFIKAPYDVIKRLFASTESPDLITEFSNKIFERDKEGFWTIPIRIVNNSSAVGEHVHVNVEILNPSSCEKIISKNMSDFSDVNPGIKVFMTDLRDIVHRGLPVIIGRIKVKMKNDAILLMIKIDIFSNKMRAKKELFNLYLNKNKFKIKKISSGFIY